MRRLSPQSKVMNGGTMLFPKIVYSVALNISRVLTKAELRESVVTTSKMSIGCMATPSSVATQRVPCSTMFLPWTPVRSF